MMSKDTMMPGPNSDERQRSLLLVDDESEVSAALQRVLYEEDYEILVAGSAKEALAILEKRPVDVIVSDQRMPEMKGTELLIRVKDRYPNIVRMILSGAADVEEVAQAMECGVIYKFLTKPIDPKLLRANLTEAFSRVASMHAMNEDAARKMFDATTALPTRKYLHDLYDDLRAEAILQHARVYMLMLRIDQHQKIVSSFGRSFAGDLLRGVATSLSRELGSRCFMGVDSPGVFLLLSTAENPEEQVLQIYRRVQGLFSNPIETGGRTISVTTSIGVAIADSDTDFENILDRSHVAMLAGVARGGSTMEFYQPQLVDSFRGQLELETELRQADIADSFRVYYQPQIDIVTDRVVGLEALLRWLHPTRGFVSPAEFIPIAERIGLIHEIGAWVLETAIADLAALRRTGAGPIQVSINVSPLQLNDPAFPGVIAAALQRSGLEAKWLMLEITESCALEGDPGRFRTLRALHDLGVKMAVDDFGVGYANLSQLAHLVFDTVKIDRSLLPRGDARSKELFASVVAMAGKLGIPTVAEGVETIDDLAAVRDAGCGVVQGFLYSQAVPFEQVASYLRDTASQQSQDTPGLKHAEAS